MARRSLQTMRPEDAARSAAARYLRQLSTTTGLNLAQFRAQLHEEEMVELLVGFTQDFSLPATLRRQCAIDVITVARGPIAPWQHDGATIDPTAIGQTGATVGEEIQATRMAADLHQKLDELVRRNVPPELWPEDVRRIASDMVAVFSAEEAAAEA